VIVEINQLVKRYKSQLVLNDIHISIEKPNIIALVGPNGAGKTTLLNCMTNIIPFQEGEIKLLGKSHNDSSLFYDVSYLQDNRILYGDLSGYDHLKFICQVQQIPMSKINEVTNWVGMTDYMNKRVRSYSLGMKQHLLLAMAIINEPKLLLMDEPLNGLDPTSAINMRNILLELYDRGTTIIVSSHNLAEIDRLTDTIYFMKDGSLLKESLKDLSTNQYRMTISDADQALSALQGANMPFTVNARDELEFNETDITLQAMIHFINEKGITILDIDKEKVGAEKRYRELFEKESSL